MILVGLGIVALSLVMGLFEVHVRRQEAWNRPRFTLTRFYAAVAGRDVELPDIGDVVLQDAESGAVREFTIDAQLQTDFARAAAKHREDVARTIESVTRPPRTSVTRRSPNVAV